MTDQEQVRRAEARQPQEPPERTHSDRCPFGYGDADSCCICEEIAAEAAEAAAEARADAEADRGP